MSRPSPATKSALVVGALAATLGGLVAAGRGLHSPPLTSWRAASDWYVAVGPATATIAALRLVAIIVASWLLLAASVELLACATARAGARALADLIAPRSLQRVVHGLAGLSLTAGLTATAPSAGTLAEPEQGVAAMRLLEDQAEPGSEGTATMRLAEDRPAKPAPAQPAPPAVLPHEDEVTVVPGDSLWSLAEEALVDAGGAEHRPSDVEVARYWRRVIETNRSALVDPSNPDLIYPGQIITLPSP
ncbi:MAG: LysM peptidoglycan-binding domain-containing protein [Actinomycetota bacterium]